MKNYFLKIRTCLNRMVSKLSFSTNHVAEDGEERGLSRKTVLIMEKLKIALLHYKKMHSAHLRDNGLYFTLFEL